MSQDVRERPLENSNLQSWEEDVVGDDNHSGNREPFDDRNTGNRGDSYGQGHPDQGRRVGFGHGGQQEHHREERYHDHLDEDDGEVDGRGGHRGGRGGRGRGGGRGGGRGRGRGGFRQGDRFAAPHRDRDRDDGGGGRYRRGGRRGGGGGGRPRGPPSHVTRTTERERGRIQNLLDSYGFIQCEMREGELFFHVSGFMSEEDEQRIQPGDDLEFLVETDHDKNKQTAVEISVLPQNTIVFEELLEGTHKGIIETALQIPRGGRYGGGNNPEPIGGKIKEFVEAGEEEKSQKQSTDESKEPESSAAAPVAEVYEFSGRDLVDPRQKLKAGDTCEFSVYVFKPSGKRSATRVSLMKPAQKHREQGIIKECRDTFGFIRCADREESRLFFHYRELVDYNYQPREKDGLEFEVETDNKNKLYATRITAIPPNKRVLFTKLFPAVYKGVIRKPLHNIANRDNWKRGGPRKVGGRLSHIIKDEDDKDLEEGFDFSDTGLMYRSEALIPGDTVKFQIAMHRPTKRRFAANIELLEKTTDGRERGTVTHTEPQKKFGFIQCESRDDNMHFQWNAAPKGIKKGDDVEFSVFETQQTQPTAIRMVKLPKGSVKFENIEPEVFEGVVSQELISPNLNTSGRHRRSGLVQCGKIKYEESPQSSSSKQQEKTEQQEEQDLDYDKPTLKTIQFNSHDLADSRHLIKVGDVVKFQIKTVLRTNERCAARVALLIPVDEDRGFGIVMNTFADYGFLRSAKYPNGVFFHFSHIIGSRIAVTRRMEFSFNVIDAVRTGKRSAVRLVQIPAGTTVLDEIDEKREYVGKITKDGRDRLRHKRDRPRRSLIYLDDSNEEQQLSFTTLDTETPRIYDGDFVRFCIATDKYSKEHRATKIRLEPKAGHVDEVHLETQGGTIKSLDSGEVFQFSMSEVKEIAKIPSSPPSPPPLSPPSHSSPPLPSATATAQQPTGRKKSKKKKKKKDKKAKAVPPSTSISTSGSSSGSEERVSGGSGKQDKTEEMKNQAATTPPPSSPPSSPSPPMIKEGDRVVFDVDTVGRTKRGSGRPAVNVRVVQFQVEVKGPLKGRILSISHKMNSDNAPRVAKGPNGTRGFGRKKDKSSPKSKPAESPLSSSASPPTSPSPKITS